MLRINYIASQISASLTVFITGVLFVIIPSVSFDTLMNGTQSGKTFVFLYALSVIGTLSLIRFILQKKYIDIKIVFFDILLFVWAMYILANGFFHGIPFSLRILDFTGLVVLYIALRFINPKYYVFLFFAAMLGGLIQAVYGNLQLWGYYPSHHGLFKMTGSFFNPGPYAGYLAGVFPLALGFYFFKIKVFTFEQTGMLNPEAEKIKKLLSRFVSRGIRYFLKHTNNQKGPLAERQQRESVPSVFPGILVFLTLIAIVLVIPASRSRASWLAVVISTCFLFLIRYKSFLFDLSRRFFNTAFKKATFVVVAILLAGASIWGLYHFKKGSADGRILIWKVTAKMVQDYPVTGVGFDRFKAHYMYYQAGYFRPDPDSEEALVAGDTNYAFNELLQLTAENGFIGLMFIFLILIVIFFGVQAKPAESTEKENNTSYLIFVAKAGMISILVFGLFAYPLQILPIKMCFVLFLAFIAGTKPPVFKTKKEVLLKKKKTLVPVFIGSIITVCSLFGAVWGTKQLAIYTNAYKSWNSAYRLYQIGAYDACLEDYNKAYPVLKTNGDFLTNYGKALSMAEKPSEAVNILQQAVFQYPNIIVFTALGDSYKNLNEPKKAERAYLHAWYMNPSKFYSKYLLVKLYDESGQTEKAIFTANELMKKEIKVESTAIQEIRERMQVILDKNSR